MSSVELEKVTTLSGNKYVVKWDPKTHDLYVGGSHIGKAKDPREAMYKAEAWAAVKRN
jgi:hypothetical protein